MLQQTIAVVLMNLRSLPERFAPSMVAIVGVAVAVAVLVSVLGMAQGFSHTVGGTGRADRAIVLANGVLSESSSQLPREVIAAVSDTPGVRHRADGKPMISPEAVVAISVRKPSSNTSVLVTLRGISASALDVRSEIVLAEGRLFRPALREMIVGQLAAAEFAVKVGDTLNLNGVTWNVVGIFAATGSGSLGSELLADVGTVLPAYRRLQFQSVTAQLESAASFQLFKDSVAINPVVNVAVERESEYYAAQSRDFAALLEYIAWIVGGLMGVGALFGAVNTMYSAVRSRSRETATLRALGFGSPTIAAAFLTEALLLCLGGAVLGAALARIFFGNATASTPAGTGEQLIYTFRLDAKTIGLGVLCGALVGVAGALFPMVSALRAPIPPALQE